MQDFEKLGVFYLGREYDLAARRRSDRLYLYDSRDLVTHAVVVGMTGSGKTGLCVDLLEEALLDGIPALVIDPKGDIANLLLTFPDLRPEDFRPWINEDDARRQDLSPEAYAAQQAERWRQGLAEWGQDGERIRRLRAAGDVAVYTPGSRSGLPVSILRSFAPPAGGDDPDLRGERIQNTVSSLLGLLGVDADPLRSREHILLSKVLEHAWGAGRTLDLAGLIHDVQTPPVTRIGALELEAFYPASDRFTLATRINNLLAAPGFDAWLDGEPLDVDQLLHTPDGKPRVSIFSIAHLGDAERMFFVSLLLTETLGWMRRQPGTTSLRALLYMDEVAGYFPPVANPPSKPPLLALVKQARAHGLGLVLATQNPVDLDYKALGNTGTWFLGRLQTERDKTRVLEGLEGASAGAGRAFDRQRTEQTLAGLASRVFLVNNVHEDLPVVIETRWAMSYLRGPLTRSQLKLLMDPRRAAAGAGAPAAPSPATPATRPVTPATPAAPARPLEARAPAAPSASAGAASAAGARPVLPPGIPQHYLPVRGPAPAGATLVYEPALFCAAALRFADAKLGVDVAASRVLLAPLTEGAVAVNWAEAATPGVELADLELHPAEGARFAPLPAPAQKPRSYATWTRELTGWLYGHETLPLWRHPASGLVSRPGESERDFRIRLAEAGRERRDALKEQLRKKYAPKAAALEERLRRAEQAVAREKEQASQQGLQAAISLGASILGAVLGRKTLSTANIGRATTAARGAGRVLKERQDIGRATETVAAVQQGQADLEAQLQAELAALDQGDPVTDPLEPVSVRPKKAHITVRLCGLAWAPAWQDAGGRRAPAHG